MICAPAFAATTANYTMTGSVTSLCTVTATGTLNFGTLINATTGATQVQTPSPSAVDNAAFCNQALTTVQVKRTNLTSTAASSSGFTNVLPISSAKVVSPQNAIGVTDSTVVTGTATSAGTTGTIAAFSQLTVSANSGTPSGALVAGNYSGVVTVTLGPQS